MGNIEDLNSITSDFDNEVPVNASVITSGLTDAERVNLRACLIATEGPFPQLRRPLSLALAVGGCRALGRGARSNISSQVCENQQRSPRGISGLANGFQ